MNIPELLSPAGGLPALHAAVDFGADAVYLGYSSFGARASAANFNEEELHEAVAYAHLYHCRVYVTVNILVKPAEVEDVRKVLSVIATSGADAVIVQDLGVAELVLREFPALELHASTQMAICNASGANFARRMGFHRVVLARECSLEDIRAVTATGVDTEVFVHGALCTAVSGRCLMSSMSGGRSGNRGRCAQPCRQEYECGGRRGALLSLRDLCLIDHIPELAKAGVHSLKIEGRLKSPEYVAVVTREYRKALDALQAASRWDRAESRDELCQIFNRGGFTLGHAMGAEDAALVTGNHVSHEGIPMGTVQSVKGNLARVMLERALQDGDSLQIHAAEDIDLRYSGPDAAAGSPASVYLRDARGVKAGNKVSRLASAEQLEQVRSHKVRPIEISGLAEFASGKPCVLQLTDSVSSVKAEGGLPQRAEKRASTVEEVRKQLSRFGDTPFVLPSDGLTIHLEDDLFLPVSELNALRRRAAELLKQKRISDFARPASRCTEAVSNTHRLYPNFGMCVITPILSLAEKLRLVGAEEVIYAPKEWIPEKLEAELSAQKAPVWLRLPPQMTERTYQEIQSLIRRASEHLKGLWLESFSQLSLQTELPVVAGEGIPVTNPLALRFLEKLGLSGYCVWPEWTRQETFDFEGKPFFWKIYGRQTVMLLEHCIKRCAEGLKTGREHCALCRGENVTCGMKEPVLTDRKGYAFPLTRTRFPEGCEIDVLGALPTELSAYLQDAERLHLTPFLHFTIESAEEQLELTSYYARLLRGETAERPFEKSTTGHWIHGVE